MSQMDIKEHDVYQENEKEIIEKCRQNDHNAYRIVYEKHGLPMLRTALRMLGDRADAEDAVQTTFVKLFQSIHNFRSQSTLSTYLYRILLNTVYDTMKKKGKNSATPLNENIHEEPLQHEKKYLLERAIDQLPKKMKICFILYAIEGFKQREIAKITKLSLGGVKSTIFQAKSRLRTQLADVLMEENP